MKIRSPIIIKWISFLGAIVIRVLINTLSYRQYGPGYDHLPTRRVKQQYLYAFWHENILVPCHTYRGLDIQVLISEHADGEIIAQACKHLGFGTIRGSKTRGGMKALRELIRASKGFHLAVMPDGPRGPRRRVELGLIYLASRCGLPIMLIGFGHDRPWRLRTWDRFVVPRPFSRAVSFAAEPIYVPADATREQLEGYRVKVETVLNAVTDYAEQLASR